ncbi:MAG: hypothetical protein M1838_001262 [Thelocarpon superellum]|nr:MAG: hypothetical protein M1838_001262 [Thelocarpon superellum]
MLDPFPSPPAFLTRLAEPGATYWHLTTLPLHVHEILFAFLLYTVVQVYISPWISTVLVPQTYRHLSRRAKFNWDVHVVSLVQSTFINTAALWVIWCDGERARMDWQERIWGYTGAGGMVQGFAAGYFLWDVVISLDRRTSGWGSLAHAISALTVTSIGFRPFAHFYGSNFILYELSSPALNVHWFLDKLGLTGSRAQFVNGILLMATFFGCRLVWGSYQTVLIYGDIWAALQRRGANAVAASYPTAATVPSVDPAAEVMRFAGDQDMPIWLWCTYLGSNTVLGFLNFYWFGKMVEALQKRFTPPEDKVPAKKA